MKLVVGLLSVLCGSLVMGHGPVIMTRYGAVEGTSEDGVDVFHSVPFAAPPTGSRRFRAPVPPQPWNDTKNVVNWPQVCPQLKLIGGIMLGKEDCLYLHVYRPQVDEPDKLPVLFWIFGGGYSLGDSIEFGWYDGKHLAKKHNVIVVAANYRVNTFGFLALKELQQEDPHGSTGNMALLDQQLALKWTQDNIANFGGDPTKVTIFGESAGGFSVCWHMASPGSKGLFHAAIMESGSCDTPQFFRDLDFAEEFSRTYSAAIGCNATGPALLACLRSKSTEEVMKAMLDWLNPNWPFSSLDVINTEELWNISPKAATQWEALRSAANTDGSKTVHIRDYMKAILADVPEEHHEALLKRLPALAPIMPWGPAIDGSPITLSDTPLNMIRKGNFNKVPWMAGSNKDEGTIFMFFVPFVVRGTTFPLDEHGLKKALAQLFGMYNSTVVNDIFIPKVLDAYPASTYGGGFYQASAIVRDFLFRCSTRRSLRAATEHGVPTYLYHFEMKLNWIESIVLGDYHTSELDFVFDNQFPPLLHLFDEHDWELAGQMGDYWSNMAWDKTPNNPDVSLQWPAYDAKADQNMALKHPLEIKSGLGKAQCDFWDEMETLLNGSR